MNVDEMIEKCKKRRKYDGRIGVGTVIKYLKEIQIEHDNCSKNLAQLVLKERDVSDKFALDLDYLKLKFKKLAADYIKLKYKIEI